MPYQPKITLSAMHPKLPDGWMSLGYGWAVSTDDQDDPNFLRAVTVARGKYQQNLILGLESLSGSTLKGKAKQWSGKYHNSRQELFQRMRAAGVVFSERWLEKRKVLVIGAWPEPKTPEPRPFRGVTTCVDDLFVGLA